MSAAKDTPPHNTILQVTGTHDCDTLLENLLCEIVTGLSVLALEQDERGALAMALHRKAQAAHVEWCYAKDALDAAEKGGAQA